MTLPKIVKRDGSTEVFNPNKIEKVVLAAGLTKGNAKKLVNVVQKWAENQKANTITSLRIRDKVIKEIQKIDRYAADLYIWYQKTLDRNNNK